MVKPLLDRIIAFFLLILGFPILFLIGLLLYIDNKGHIFFIQERIGKNSTPFLLFKLRTMNETGSSWFGQVVRKSSLDELPQLFNILKGEMSLVGPRPLLPEYLNHYTSEENKRHDVLPGITGWAQVNGRNSLSWAQRFLYDLYYVEKISLSIDIKILILTFVQLFRWKQADFESLNQETFSEYANKR